MLLGVDLSLSQLQMSQALKKDQLIQFELKKDKFVEFKLKKN